MSDYLWAARQFTMEAWRRFAGSTTKLEGQTLALASTRRVNTILTLAALRAKGSSKRQGK